MLNSNIFKVRASTANGTDGDRYKIPVGVSKTHRPLCRSMSCTRPVIYTVELKADFILGSAIKLNLCISYYASLCHKYNAGDI